MMTRSVRAGLSQNICSIGFCFFMEILFASLKNLTSIAMDKQKFHEQIRQTDSKR